MRVSLKGLHMDTSLHDRERPKRPVNLSVNQELLEQAKAAGIPLSQTLEEALVAKLKAKRQAEWRQENREGIAAYNQRIAENGTFSDEFRRF
jgi:antitoxin CcdA